MAWWLVGRSPRNAHNPDIWPVWPGVGRVLACSWPLYLADFGRRSAGSGERTLAQASELSPGFARHEVSQAISSPLSLGRTFLCDEDFLLLPGVAWVDLGEQRPQIGCFAVFVHLPEPHWPLPATLGDEYAEVRFLPTPPRAAVRDGPGADRI